MRKTTTPLYNVRVARTMNQHDLARLAGVSQQTISKAERGIVHLSVDLEMRLAAILGVSHAELFPESARATA